MENSVCCQVGQELWMTWEPTAWDQHLKWGQSSGTEPFTL